MPLSFQNYRNTIYFIGESHCTPNEFCICSQDKGDEIEKKKSFVLKGDIKYTQSIFTYNLISPFCGHLPVSDALNILYTKGNSADTEFCHCQTAYSLLFIVM